MCAALDRGNVKEWDLSPGAVPVATAAAATSAAAVTAVAPVRNAAAPTIQLTQATFGPVRSTI